MTAAVVFTVAGTIREEIDASLSLPNRLKETCSFLGYLLLFVLRFAGLCFRFNGPARLRASDALPRNGLNFLVHVELLTFHCPTMTITACAARQQFLQ